MPHRFGILACVYSADPDRSRYPGAEVTFTLTPADGYTLTGADYPGASLTRTGAAYILTLPDVRYSVAVAVTAEKSDTVLYYNDNCGGGWVTVPVTPAICG